MTTSKNSGQDLEKYIFKEWKWCGKVGSEVHFRIKKIFWKGESKIGNEKYSLKSDQGNEDHKIDKKYFEKVKVNWEMGIRRSLC